MGSSSDSFPAPSAEFLAVFRTLADTSGAMTFERFMAIALYHPEVGYYRQSRPRVGRGKGTDFFTATTSGTIFGELISSACAKLLRAAGRNPANHTFVEIGAEPDSVGVLTDLAHPFAGVEVRRIGDPLALEGECVIFSNELFDAQPCRRTVYRNGRWRTVGVRIKQDRFEETEVGMPDDSSTWAGTEGYRFDQPVAAAALADQIAAEPWRGIFVAIDYGKTFRTLVEETPAGTLRAYFRHSQSNNLLIHPGEQDLTCHICWDWIESSLRQRGFSNPSLEFQEAFFIRHAGNFLATVSATDAAQFSPRKQALLQLLHPSHMGQKFQVMHAIR